MGRIILARAGATDYDEQDRIVGTLDLPVSVKGQAELASLAQELRDSDVDCVYCSTEQSARQSADYLGDQLESKVRVLDELHNLDFGLWQGLKTEEVRRKHRKVFKQWQESPHNVCPPMGETLDEVRQRVEKSLKPVLKRCQNHTCLIVVPEPLRLVVHACVTDTVIERLSENGSAQTLETIDL